jgi:hypothetical protein
VLPEHASAYFSPRSPPTTSAHQTIETEAVRLDPAIDPDNAVTQPLKIDGLQPPPWLGDRLLSNAPTVLIPVVRERRRKKRLVAGVIAAAIGAAAGIVYGVSRPSPRAAPSPVTLVSPPPNKGSEPPAHLEPVAAPPSVPQPGPISAEPAPVPPQSSAEFKQLTARAVPSSRRSVAPRRAAPAASGAPSAWLKAEPPKVWVK